MHKHHIKIHHIFTSIDHNYFTREKYHIGNAETFEHAKISLHKDRGLQNDRFEFSKYPITLFSVEVLDLIEKNLQIKIDPKLFRRNIIISGIHLNSLIGQRFFLNGVLCEGIAHCAPCPWMNAAIANGTYKLMKGRGGLRIKVLDEGVLETGETTIQTDH